MSATGTRPALTPSILVLLLGSGYSHDEEGGSLSTQLSGCACSLIPVHKCIQKGAGIFQAEITEQLIELMSKPL